MQSCHSYDGQMMPNYPAHQLNKTFPARWRRTSLINGPPTATSLVINLPAPAAQWDNPQSGSLMTGRWATSDSTGDIVTILTLPANTSGLNLTLQRTHWHQHGRQQIPVATGKGSGGRRHSIASQPMRLFWSIVIAIE
ncbi:MAG: hypothetical protein R2788_12170 [Saprospiraceae bacterium]